MLTTDERKHAHLLIGLSILLFVDYIFVHLIVQQWFFFLKIVLELLKILVEMRAS